MRFSTMHGSEQSADTFTYRCPSAISCRAFMLVQSRKTAACRPGLVGSNGEALATAMNRVPQSINFETWYNRLGTGERQCGLCVEHYIFAAHACEG